MKIPAVAVSMALFGSASAFVTRQSPSVGRSVARSLVASQRPVVSAGTDFGTMQSRSVSTTAPTALSMSKDDKKKPFETWSFDSHCKSMEWSPLSEAELIVSGEFDEGSDADLVIVGVAAPASDDEDEDEDSSDDKEEEPPVLTGAAKALDDKLGGALSDLMAENAKAFKNGAGVGSTTPTLRVAIAGSKAKRYVLVGLGKEGEDWEDGDITKIGNAIASKCSAEKKALTASVLLSGKVGDDSAALSDISSAFYSTLYADNRYRTGAKKETPAEDLKTVTVSIEGGVSDQSGADAAIAAGKSLTMGVSLCRDIVNAPHKCVRYTSLLHFPVFFVRWLSVKSLLCSLTWY